MRYHTWQHSPILPLLSDANCVRWFQFAFDYDSGYEAAIFPDNLSYQNLLMLVVTLPCATIIILLRFMSGKGAVLTPCSCSFRGGIYNKYVEQLKQALGTSFAHPEMVFPSAKGNYRDRSSVLISLKRMTKGTEFSHMTLHKLRHCNATMLLNMGVELKAISDHLGHCDINVTANTYADVLEGMKRNIAASIEQKLMSDNTASN